MYKPQASLIYSYKAHWPKGPLSVDILLRLRILVPRRSKSASKTNRQVVHCVFVLFGATTPFCKTRIDSPKKCGHRDISNWYGHHRSWTALEAGNLVAMYDWDWLGLCIFTLPSGQHTKNYGKSPFFMGKLTISMAIFRLTNCWHYQRV